MAKITREFLKGHNACTELYNYFMRACLGLNKVNQVKKMLRFEQDFGIWLLVRVLDYKDYCNLAILASELVIEPNACKSNRRAIEMAKICLANPTRKTTEDAINAAYHTRDKAFASAPYSVAFEVPFTVPNIVKFAISYENYAYQDCSGIKETILNYGLNHIN